MEGEHFEKKMKSPQESVGRYVFWNISTLRVGKIMGCDVPFKNENLQ
jgi:hypothetical protein